MHRLHDTLYKGDYVKKISKIVAVCSGAVIFLASCSANIGEGNKASAPLQPLSCVAVLPAVSAAGDEEIVSRETARSLENGAAFASGVLARELAGNTKARVVSNRQVEAFTPEVMGGMTGLVSDIGQKIGCDGVLVTTVRRFKQREGTEYASDDPASADVYMTLVHSGSGAVLWTAEFRETQESFLDNILSFEKVQNRGLKWISVEQMVDQGISERLATCPYLN